MKRRDLLHLLTNSLLAFAAGFCGAGCIVTAFRLPVTMPVLAWLCAICSLAVCLSLQFRWGFLVLLLPVLPGLEYLSHTDVAAQLQQLAYEVLHRYHNAYGWPEPGFAVHGGLEDLTLALALVALLATLVAAVSLSRRRSFGAVAAPVLLLATCLVVVDTPPDSVYVFWLLSDVALVLLTAGARRREDRAGSRLVALALVPVLLANWFVMTVRPRQDYQTPQAPGLYEKLEQWLGQFSSRPGVGQGPGDNTSPPHMEQTRVDLSVVGPKGQSEYVTMRVHSSIDELLYLRGRSYGTYDGKGWIADAPEEEALVILDRTYLNMAGSKPRNLKITTIGLPKFRYTGYYLLQKATLYNGRIPNPDEQQSYVIPVHSLNKNWKMRYQTEHKDLTLAALREQTRDMGAYLQLPENTRAGALAYLEKWNIQDQMNAILVPERIAGYVQSSASYNLNTGRMDPEAEDFALWFLEESDTGYCVHYATAAVVLLRAAGIPARYVEGYALNVEAYQETEVRMRHAHAWVEYYLPDIGWLILEPTPAAFTREPPRPTQPPTEPTTQPTVPPTTEPTLPTRPTVPPTTLPPTTEPTLPTRPTEPATSQPTTPGGATSPTGPAGLTPEPAPRDWSWLWKLLKWLVAIGLGLLVLMAQRLLRLKLRKRRLHRGRHNEQALTAWRHTRYLARLRRQQPPEALQELAQKARFSQHTLTWEELAQFEAYFHRSLVHLQSRPWPLRLVYRWILALW